MGKLEASTTVVGNLKAPPIYKIALFQFFVSIVGAFGAYILADMVTAYSVLLGGLISTVPNGYFARKVFRYRGARHTEKILKSFYAGEVGKIIMTASMFALVFAGIKPLNPLAVILSYVVTIIAGLVASAYVNLRVAK